MISINDSYRIRRIELRYNAWPVKRVDVRWQVEEWNLSERPEGCWRAATKRMTHEAMAEYLEHSGCPVKAREQFRAMM